MEIRKMPFEEIELLSYADIAYKLLCEDKDTKTTPVLFKEVCSLLRINEDNMFEMIGDFYTTLTTDKRFLLLDNSEWDLKENHKVKLVIEEDDDEDEEIAEEEEEAEESEDDAVTNNSDDYNDDSEEMDDLEDLAIITEEEMEE